MNRLSNATDPIAPWLLAELGCWTIVALTPMVAWINGPSVSADQYVVRTGVFLVALFFSVGLRVANMVRGKLGKGDRPASVRGRRNMLVAALLAVHASMLAWGAWRQSPTIDEVPYLAAGVSHWHLGRFELCRVNPPLVRLVAALPLVACAPATDWTKYPTQDPSPTYRTDFEVGEDFVSVNSNRAFLLFSLARWACIPFSVLGAWLCFRWGSDLFGHAAGVLALSLWCVSPNIIAHEQLMTPDGGGTAVGLAAAYCFWRWLREAGWGQAAIAGLAMGAAQLARTTWIILFAIWPVLWLLFEAKSSWRVSWTAKLRNAAQMPLILLLGLYVLNLGYLFDGTFRRLGEYEFVSPTLAGFKSVGERVSGNRFRGGALAVLPLPLPQDYVKGIDIQKGDFDGGIPSYLRGEWRHGGWWYYYAYALLVKEPLGTWTLTLLALTCALLCREYRSKWRDEVMLLLPALAVFILVSSQTGFNHHLRYVLGALPFAFISLSRVARSLVLGHRAVAVAGTMALAWSVLSSLWTYPHSLSYFNESVGGPAGGEYHLIDSNIDWGQDLLFLKRWLANHPEARPLRIAFFPTVIRPELAGIRSDWPPIDPRSPRLSWLGTSEVGPHPGWYAISVNERHARERQYDYFLEFEPVARAGYSVAIFHITRDGANEVRRKIGVPPLDPEG